jgi:hypothetical protein
MSHDVWRIPHMQDSTSRTILAANLRRMIDRSGLPSNRAWSKKMGLNVRMIDRLLGGENAVTLDKIEEIARTVGLEPWQLLLPDLDPSEPPDAPISEADRDMLTKLRRLLGDGKKR